METIHLKSALASSLAGGDGRLRSIKTTRQPMRNYAQTVSNPAKDKRPNLKSGATPQLTFVGNARESKVTVELTGEAFLRLPDVIALTGIKSSTIYDLIKDKKFPAPEKITLRASGWRMRDIASWLKCPMDWRPEPDTAREPDHAQ